MPDYSGAAKALRELSPGDELVLLREIVMGYPLIPCERDGP
jgi:hypothetical protein